jgi:outer membrane protein assembly factor BamB
MTRSCCRRSWRRIGILSLVLVPAAFAAVTARSANVLTHHNDPARTGANLEETALTPATVTNRFGKLFARHVHGQIYAQPLVVSGIEVSNKVRNVVYVATMENDVYAFDADDPDDESYLWRAKLGTPVPYNEIPEPLVGEFTGYNINPSIGIASTPVIDPVKRRMWVATKIFGQDGTKHYFLKCLDITTGQVVGSSSDIGTNENNVVLQAKYALQRPALLLANNTIYLAFGSHQDIKPYSGWVVAFDADTLALKHTYCVTPGDDNGMGGIWQSGSGPAADSQGNIYFMTGNGTFDGAKTNLSTSFIKLGPDLKLLDWFTPWNYQRLSDEDLDLGSSGPMLLPGSDQLVGGGKQGWLYLLDCNHMGNLQQRHATPPALQEFKASDHWTLTWLSWLFPAFGYHHIHGSPVYWNSAQRGPLVYVWPEQTHLKAFSYDPTAHFQKKPVLKGPKAPKGMPGGFLSVSANGDHDGILWTTSPLSEDALTDTVRGVMRAFDALTLQQLWSTDKNTPDDLFNFAKNCPPTVANGKVYLATFSDRFNVYGLLPPPTASPTQAAAGTNQAKKKSGHRPGQTK